MVPNTHLKKWSEPSKSVTPQKVKSVQKTHMHMCIHAGIQKHTHKHTYTHIHTVSHIYILFNVQCTSLVNTYIQLHFLIWRNVKLLWTGRTVNAYSPALRYPSNQDQCGNRHYSRETKVQEKALHSSRNGGLLEYGGTEQVGWRASPAGLERNCTVDCRS